MLNHKKAKPGNWTTKLRRLRERRLFSSDAQDSIVSLLVSFAAKIMREGETEEKAFQEYIAWWRVLGTRAWR